MHSLLRAEIRSIKGSHSWFACLAVESAVIGWRGGYCVCCQLRVSRVSICFISLFCVLIRSPTYAAAYNVIACYRHFVWTFWDYSFSTMNLSICPYFFVLLYEKTRNYGIKLARSFKNSSFSRNFAVQTLIVSAFSDSCDYERRRRKRVHGAFCWWSRYGAHRRRSRAWSGERESVFSLSDFGV